MTSALMRFAGVPCYVALMLALRRPAGSPLVVALLGLLLAGCGDSPGARSATPRTPRGPAVAYDGFAALADPLAPARWLPGRSFLASSRALDSVSGFDNVDWNHYAGREGDADVLLDVRGPGVLTRFWATARTNPTTGDPAIDFAVIERAALAVEIDGRRVIGGTRGVPLAELVGAESIPGFVEPWVAGLAESGGGVVLDVPLHFRERARVLLYRGDVENVYYQIDGRLLPAGSTVPVFDGALSAEARDTLTLAAALWSAPDARDATFEAMGATVTREERVVAPGERFTINVGRGLLVRAAVHATASDGALAGVEVDLVVDGVPVLDARPLPYLVESAHATPYVSALTAASARDFAFAYPSALDEGATLAVINTTDAAISLVLELLASPVRPSRDVGVLRGVCSDVLSAGDRTDLLLANLRGRTRYAGQVLAIRTDLTEWNVLEGDHEVRCDDDWLLGTGTEDYFGGAFYFWRGTFARPTTGAFGRWISGTGAAEASVYRHHLADGIECERNFSFSYESYAATHGIDACVFYYAYPES